MSEPKKTGNLFKNVAARGNAAARKTARRPPPPSRVGMVDFARNLPPRSPEEEIARQRAIRDGQARGGRASGRLRRSPPPSKVGL